MKIGFVLDDSLDSSDGVQQYILTLGAWLVTQGHEVHYLVGQTKRQDIPHIHSLSRNISVHFNGNKMTIPLPAKSAPIRQLLQDEQFDVLHVQMPYSPFMAAKVVRLAPANTRIFGTFHILPFGKLQAWGAKALAWWSESTTARLQQIWAVSEPARIFAAQIGIQSSVLPNVVNLEQFQNSQPKERGFRLVFLGRLVERKGCAVLLQAFAKALPQMPDAHLVIGGKGPQLPTLQAWVTQHHLEDKVEFVGFVDEAAKPAFLNAADVAVFPSLGGESFGIVLIESMAAGATVTLGGDNPGYRSVLGDIPQTLVNAKDTAAFAKVLQELYNEPDLRKKIHDQQRELVKGYDVAVVGKKLVSYYKADKG